MPKSKPLAGKDTLLLLLTHHWARDESIYRTEDDRLDFATILLFDSLVSEKEFGKSDTLGSGSPQLMRRRTNTKRRRGEG